MAGDRVAAVATAAPSDPDTLSLGVVAAAVGGGVGGVLFIAAMVYVMCLCTRNRERRETKTPNSGAGVTNQTVDTTMNASKMNLFGGKEYDTEIGSKSPIAPINSINNRKDHEIMT